MMQGGGMFIGFRAWCLCFSISQRLWKDLEICEWMMCVHISLPMSSSHLSLVGIPSIKWCGAEGDYNVMVMELLGPSLEDLFNFCSRKFSLKTVLLLADQMVSSYLFLCSSWFPFTTIAWGTQMKLEHSASDEAGAPGWSWKTLARPYYLSSCCRRQKVGAVLCCRLAAGTSCQSWGRVLTFKEFSMFFSLFHWNFLSFGSQPRTRWIPLSPVWVGRASLLCWTVASIEIPWFLVWSYSGSSS